MIRVQITGKSVAGVFPYVIECDPKELNISGKSRQPLLDACRKLAGLEHDQTRIGLFHGDSDEFALATTVGAGAKLTVRESDKDGPRFVRYRPFVTAP